MNLSFDTDTKRPHIYGNTGGQNKMEQLKEQIRLLSIFHYVVGGIAALFSLFPTIHLVMRIAMFAGVFTLITLTKPETKELFGETN